MRARNLSVVLDLFVLFMFFNAFPGPWCTTTRKVPRLAVCLFVCLFVLLLAFRKCQATGSRCATSPPDAPGHQAKDSEQFPAPAGAVATPSMEQRLNQRKIAVGHECVGAGVLENNGLN